MKKLLPFAKGLVSLGLLFFLLKIVDLKSLRESLMGMDLIYLFLGTVAMFIMLILASLRWRICLLPQEINLSLGDTLNYSLIGFFFNNFTPSTIGGDVAKGVIVSRFSKRKLGTVISILMDRLIGLLTTGIFAIFALVISFRVSLPVRIRLVILLFVCIVGGLLFLVLHRGISHKIAGAMSSMHFQNLADKVISVSDSFSVYRTYPGCIKNALGLSLVTQLGNIFINYLLALGLGMELSFLYFVVFIPLIMAIMSIPVSLNGLGLREGAYVFFFNLVNISKEKSLALSITYYAVILAMSLIGGILLLWSSIKARGERHD